MQFGEPDNRFLNFRQDTGGACFEWCVTVRVPVYTDGIAVHVVSIQGQPNQRKSGSRVVRMTADADSVNEILAGCEDLWNRCKNLWRLLICERHSPRSGLWRVYVLPLAPLYYEAGNMI